MPHISKFTRMKRLSLILCLASLLFVSCQHNPHKYQSEIEDAVRFQLAVANSLSICDDVEDFLELCTWMVGLTEENNLRTQSYRDVLLERSSADAVSSRLLELYNNMDIVCSELIPTQQPLIWSFTEINSDVRFTFELIPTQDGGTYYRCTANSDDLHEVTTRSLRDMFLNYLDLEF